MLVRVFKRGLEYSGDKEGSYTFYSEGQRDQSGKSGYKLRC